MRRWAGSINIWPNAVLKFNYPLGVQIVCLGFPWILINIDIFFFNLKILEKNDIMNTEQKKQFGVIRRSHFNDYYRADF